MPDVELLGRGKFNHAGLAGHASKIPGSLETRTLIGASQMPVLSSGKDGNAIGGTKKDRLYLGTWPIWSQ